ncbi:hypothetical protein A3G55_04145 [Candidatus Giovannonibacteria bacterium RIFCSPLOWO2_12_FULL_44_25]|uniref:Uncharacterized protein n=4 Tax=Candidatus Giovannoniibacteriota TaxID=1752738 RepID=A0A0G1IDU0_9BACT|nr:MAG: hypothetical protein UW15_C0005G0003 [Parcubacteria group bacterium GW2011_GWC1_44_10]KKT56983.1 MAG: hypothetical protein UW49_C0009G0004 [Candidatus Giovannonibacteria bacterium GW2011_GWB1_44_23]KKT59594.1 MAG: hypothetical protein UW53_C0010G0004 [Candidatus Giovannonibacteria bacterium GW2011_GWA1_44_25]KKT84032.1 MAG: hypothetical protein UW81_C0007G0027 [Candidatus Giovannonibacteria bacterium GW2011_GWC2_44_9]OGF49864.1 MAG: hypothetical protein A2120_01430 [Candidatus Giovannon
MLARTKVMLTCELSGSQNVRFLQIAADTEGEIVGADETGDAMVRFGKFIAPINIDLLEIIDDLDDIPIISSATH